MKESNAVTSAKNKQITPEVLEEAIGRLDTETYCCYALASAIEGKPYILTSFEADNLAREFLEPLLQQDGISDTGTWTFCGTMKLLPFTRSEWLRKIAQELREGKISA
jgi:hypothetical protein